MKDVRSARRAYEAPKVRGLGNFRDLTLGLSDGDFTDKDFPVETPKKDLTFS